MAIKIASKSSIGLRVIVSNLPFQCGSSSVQFNSRQECVQLHLNSAAGLFDQHCVLDWRTAILIVVADEEGQFHDRLITGPASICGIASRYFIATVLLSLNDKGY